MPDEALEELAALDPAERDRADILEMRLLILMHARRWKEALTAARKLMKLVPDATGGFVHTAFCLHELGRTTEAKAVLLSGPASLAEDATYHYNLACYECALGNIESAQAHLETSFAMDKKFREFAKIDPDLAALRKEQ